MFLSKRWHHHTASGGYDRTAETFGGRVVTRPRLNLLHKIFRHTFDVKHEANRFLLDYSYQDLWAERKLIFEIIKKRPGIVHVLYGDEQLDLILRWKKRLGIKLVASFHLPWHRSRERFEAQKDILGNNLDAAICVSRDLADEINSFFGCNLAYFVPHGIDTKVFKPNQSNQPARKGRLQLLTVGFHMRDMKLIHRAIDWSESNSLPIDFEYIGPEWTWSHFTGCRNVLMRENVSEQELINAYHNADALLLPVTAATANNSLLEAIACGLPVISTNTAGITDYLNEEAGWLLPPNGESDLRDLLYHLALDKTLAQSKRSHAAAFASRFDWINTNALLQDVYNITLKL